MSAQLREHAAVDAISPAYLAAIGAVADIANSSSPSSVFDVCVDAAANLCSWRLALVTFRDAGDRTLFRAPSAWKLRGEDGLAELTAARQLDRRLNEDGLLTRVVHSRRPVAWSRLEPLSGETWLQAAADSGMRSVAAFPVLCGADVKAVFEVYHDQPSKIAYPLDETFRLLAVLAGRAIERAGKD